MPISQKISPDELSYKRLEQTDNLSTFDCSKDDAMGLNEFIHEEAKQYQKERLGVTYLFHYKKQIVGFATLAMSQIEIKYAKRILPFPTTIKHYPALLIGRLATHNEFRRKEVGKNICLWVISLARKLSKMVGCRLVIVLTQGKPVEFYKKKCNFKVFPRFEKKTRKWMFIQVPQN